MTSSRLCIINSGITKIFNGLAVFAKVSFVWFLRAIECFLCTQSKIVCSLIAFHWMLIKCAG